MVLTWPLSVVALTGPQGALPIGIASAHAREIVQQALQRRGSVDTGRFIPDIHAPTLKTSAWRPPLAAKTPGSRSTPANGYATAGAAATGRQPGEQLDLRTAASSTYLNADGTWTLKAYSTPIHYQDAQGKWQNIDNSLVSDSSVAGYAYGNKANGWHVHFASAAGGANLLYAQLPTGSLSDTLVGAAHVAPTTNRDTITYPGVFPNVDLLYGVGETHIEEELLLHAATVPPTYTFSYHMPGVTASQDAAGDVVLQDGQDHTLLVIGSPVMYEANAQGAPVAGGASSVVPLTLTGTGPDFTLTWAGNDPGTNTTNGNIYANTIDSSANPNSTSPNLITSGDLKLGNCNAIPTNNWAYGSGVSRIYLKFPIDPPPANVRVTSADLALMQDSTNTGGGVPIQVSEIKTAWNATTLTWNNHPTTTWRKGPGGTTGPGGYQYIHIDVAETIYDWWQYGQELDGFRLQYADETKPCETFNSDNFYENVQQPTLTVNYAQDQTAPGGGLTINGGATYTNSGTVALAPAGSDTGATSVWNSNWASVSGVGSNGGTNASWSVNSPSNTQLTATTAGCGSTACPAQTFFTTAEGAGVWPTYTALFKTDLAGAFTLGVAGQGSNNQRFDVVANAGSTSFTLAEHSLARDPPGTVTTDPIPNPFAITANTWYYAEIDFPLSSVVEMYVWPANAAKPATPTLAWTGLAVTNPGLTFYEQGDNGANLHSYSIANVNITTQASGATTTGYGVWGMQFSNDGGTTWSCPSVASGTAWCVTGPTVTAWALLATGDGRKTVSVRYSDNAGNVSALGSGQIILDTTPPTVSLTTPGSVQGQGREVRGIATVTASATDPTAPDGTSSGVASVALYVDGQQTGQALSGTSVPTFLWDTTNLAPGEHTLTVKATDNAGNTATSAGVVVDVSNTGQMPYETYAMRDLPAGGIAAGANVATGDALVTEQDLDIPGRGPDLALGRTYNALAPVNGLFGWGWSSDLDEALAANGDGSVTYRDPSGGYHVFLPNGSGGYVTPPGLYLGLVKNGDGTYTLTSHDQTKTTFNAGGYITGITDRNGNALTISYTTGNVPTTMTDVAGRQLALTVSGGHVTQIAAPGARTYGYAYDGSGNLSDYTDPAGVDTRYSYATPENHLLTGITLNDVSAGGSDQQTNVTTTLSYDSNNRLVKVLDPLGYDAGVSYVAPTSTTGAQTTVRQLQTNSGTTPATSNSVYEQTVYTATTDGSGAVAQIQNALGDTTQYQYNSSEDVTQVTDPDGHVSTSMYDANGNELTHTVDPNRLKLTTSWTYDSANNVLTETEPLGIVTQYTYDALGTGNLKQEVRDSGHSNVTTSYTYDTYGEVLTKIDPMGVVMRYTYDNQGDVIQTVENCVDQTPTTPPSYKCDKGSDSANDQNITTSATYDVLGEKLTAKDALGIVTRTSYDIRGDVIQTMANCVDLTPNTYKCDAAPNNANPKLSTQNVATSYAYDALGRQVRTNNPLGVITVTQYDADGRDTKQIANCVDNTPGTYACDAGSDSANDQNITTTTTAYDAAGNVTLATDAKGNTTTTTYDADNRAIEVVVANKAGAQVSDTKTTYDADGNTLATQTMDGKNNPTTSYSYDAAGRKATESAPAANPGASDQSGQSNVTSYNYDADGNVLTTTVTNSKVTPGPVRETTATFDHLGHQTQKTEDANGSATSGPTGSGPQTTTYAYDADGRQTSTTDPSNNTTTTSYDALGRVTQVQHPDGTQDTTTYYPGGLTNTQSNCGGSKAGTSTTADTYDALGRVATETKTDCTGAPLSSVAYTYDEDGNKWTQSTSTGNGPSQVTQWRYDHLDRIETMSDGSRSYAYDSDGNVINMTALGNLTGGGAATAASYTYDGGNRLLTQTDTVGPSNSTLHNYSYAYDGDGNRNSITEDGSITSYTYDGANQLLTVVSGATTLASYSYDANHNRPSMTTAAGTTSYSYDTNTHTLLTSKTDPTGKVTTYSYDTNGNLTSAVYDPTGANQTMGYTYDQNNRLTTISRPDGSTVSFSYDADGNRVSTSVTTGGSTPTTTGVKDVYQVGHLAAQTDLAGNLLATFTYDSDGVPTSVVVGSDPNYSPRYYYVYNGHGDVVALVDANGTVVAHYHYDEFGNLTDNSETIPNANGWVNPYRYDGRDGVRYDAETGLYWMSVRVYDPALGRFLSRDPLGRAPLFFANQPYVYAGNNPLINVDPSGQRYAVSAGARQSRTSSTPTNKRMSTTSGGKCTTKKSCDQERIKAYNALILCTVNLLGVQASSSH